MDDTTITIKDYLLREFLPGAGPDELGDSTSLITGGVLDSLATLKLVAFLEERFGITIQAHETGVDYMDTLADIAALVVRKRAGG